MSATNENSEAGHLNPDIKPLRSILVIGLWIGGATIILSVLFPLVLKAREAARETQSRNNLKQIGLALHNYHDVYSVLPPGGSIRADGTPHHGWMTSIMPYLDASPIYSMLDFDEAWDHPFNVDLFTFQSPTFLNPSNPQPRKKNDYAITHYMSNPQVFHRNSSVGFEDLEVGNSQRWIAGEIADGFQPAAYPFNWRAWNGITNSSPMGYGLTSKNVTQFLLADGSVKKVTKQAAKEFWGNYSDSTLDIKHPKYAVPPVTFPAAVPEFSVRNTSSDNATITAIAVEKEDSLQLRFRIFSWDKGNYDTNLSPGNIEFAAIEFPNATHVTIPRSLGAAHLKALGQFNSLRVIKANEILFDELSIEAIRDLSKLQRIHLNSISNDDYQRLTKKIPKLDIEYDFLRD